MIISAHYGKSSNNMETLFVSCVTSLQLLWIIQYDVRHEKTDLKVFVVVLIYTRFILREFHSEYMHSTWWSSLEL